MRVQPTSTASVVQSHLSRTMRCSGQPTTENSLRPEWEESATVHTASMLPHHLSGTIYHDTSEMMTLVANNLLAIWRHFCLHWPISQRRLWECLFKRHFINDLLTYLQYTATCRSWQNARCTLTRLLPRCKNQIRGLSKVSRTFWQRFKDFQGPCLFSTTFKALKIWGTGKNSRTFKNQQESWLTRMVHCQCSHIRPEFLPTLPTTVFIMRARQETTRVVTAVADG